MGDDLHRFCDERQITGALRGQIERLGQGDIAVWERLITVLRPSANTFRELFAVCREVCARDRISLAELFTDAELVPLIVEDDTLPRKERKRRIDEALRRRRFPELTKIRAALEERIRAIGADTGLRLNLPADLEGDGVTVTVRLASSADAQRTGERIAALSTDRRFQEVLDILVGGDEAERGDSDQRDDDDDE